MDGTGIRHEIVLVNDGSTDGTLAAMAALADTTPELTIVNLTRNFGKELALTAGLRHAMGDAIVVLDADLQDPPELIPAFIEKYTEGYDVVYGRRISREGETWLKTFTAGLFYRAMSGVGPVQLPKNVGDFRLISRRVNEALLSLPERHRFMKGLFAWVGYPAVAIDYDRHPRFAGKTKWRYSQLLGLSVEAITSFTILPLRVVTIVGFASGDRPRSSTAARLPGPHADLRRLRRRLSDAVSDHADARRRRADRPRRHRRVPRASLRRGEGTPALSSWRACPGPQPRPSAGPWRASPARLRPPMSPRRHGLLRIGRFSIVGVLNTLVDLAVFMLLVKLLSVPLVPANLLAFAVALANSYVLNRLWTFRDSAARAQPRQHLALSSLQRRRRAHRHRRAALLARPRPAGPRRQAPLDRREHGLELPHHAPLGVPAAVLPANATGRDYQDLPECLPELGPNS